MYIYMVINIPTYEYIYACAHTHTYTQTHTHTHIYIYIYIYIYTGICLVQVGCVLWHINHCVLFIAKLYIYIYIKYDFWIPYDL